MMMNSKTDGQNVEIRSLYSGKKYYAANAESMNANEISDY
jgi:YHS domain-containing protein